MRNEKAILENQSKSNNLKEEGDFQVNMHFYYINIRT